MLKVGRLVTHQQTRTWTALACTTLAVICLFAVAILATVRSSQRERASNRLVLHTCEVSDNLRDMLTHIDDTETGQRGYLLTGSSRYLVPFNQGRKLVPNDLERLQRVTHDSPVQQRHAMRLRLLVAAKLTELQQTVDLYHAGHAQRALSVVRSGCGQHLMESIRAELSQMQAVESHLMSVRMAAAVRASRLTLLWVRGGFALTVVLLGGAGWSVASLRIRQAQAEERIRDYTTVLEFQNGEMEKANAELEALATTDGLTGLLNHRVFHNRLVEEAARAEREGTTLAVVMLDLDNFKFFNDAYGHPTGDAVLRHVAECLQGACRLYDTLARFGGDEFALLLPNVGATSASEIEARLRADLAGIAYHHIEQDREQEMLVPITISVGAALFPQDGLSQSAVVRLADQRLLRSKTGGAAETEADLVRAEAAGMFKGFLMLDALVAAVDNKDRYTRKHSEDVMEYSLMIARELGLDEAALQTIGMAALLHDLGKIGVPDAILRKPGKLSDEEFEVVKQHPQMGAIIVQAVPGLEDTLDAVRHHHERWDGGGYPDRLEGEDCPLMARLMAVADAFSAMTTDRPYRKGMDRHKALAILEAGAGVHWDPLCVWAFLRGIGRHQDRERDRGWEMARAA